MVSTVSEQVCNAALKSTFILRIKSKVISFWGDVDHDTFRFRGSERFVESSNIEVNTVTCRGAVRSTVGYAMAMKINLIGEFLVGPSPHSSFHHLEAKWLEQEREAPEDFLFRSSHDDGIGLRGHNETL